MKRIGQWPLGCLLLGVVCITIAGCGQDGDNKGGSSSGGGASGIAGYSAEDLTKHIGEYMPPLEGGKLEIAAPRGWVWSRAGSDYLVGFHKEDSSLNNLPRILVAVEDSPFSGLTDANKENLGQLVKLVSESVDATKLKGPVQPIILGNTACARYVDMRKRTNALVARQTLQTVVKGRLYTIRLEAYDREFTKHCDMGYAVAASMKFSASETPDTESDIGDDPETSETETTDSGEESPATDASEPSEPATTDSE